MESKLRDPLVSICIPTYNYAHYLRQAINSCLSQSYKQIELIIVDDASTDNSGELIRSFNDSRIRFLENPVRLGLVENWNKTLSLVRGEIVKFLFADDYLVEDAIERIVKVFENPDVALVFSAATVVDAQGKQTYVHQPYPKERHLRGLDEIKRCLKKGNYIGGPSSVAIRTSIMERAGRFDEALRFHADLQMWLRIMLKGDAYFLAEPLVYIRQHEGSETSRLEETGQIPKETLKFLIRCLQNEQLRSLLSESETSELIDQYVNLSISELLRTTKSRPYWTGWKILATGARKSRILPYLYKVLCSSIIYRAMKLIRRFSSKEPRISFSQCGEDLIIDFIFDALDLSKPSYLDIGAHHPTYLNNTYLFYQKGCNGVCIEPNPALLARIERIRKRDICLNVGVGISLEREADFFVMSSDTLSTFSKETAERYQSYGNQKIEKVIRIPLVPVNDIIKEHFKDCPAFVSLDVESMELEVLKTFDFTSFRPAVFCIETLTYTEDKSERKIDEISGLMHSKGYFTYADTYINTIFVDKQAWNSRR